jgi:GT2 family glycosyltransferase
VNIADSVLILNQRDRTLRCLASLLAVEMAPFHTILWDNGSPDETIEAVRGAFPQFLVHRHPSRLGVDSGRNTGAKLAVRKWDPTKLLVVGNDMLVEPDFMAALLKPITKDKHEGAL